MVAIYEKDTPILPNRKKNTNKRTGKPRGNCKK